MGKCGENQDKNQRESQNQNPTKVQRKPVKVKYISSPMMIKASNALEFRAIVQQLTGFNSDDPVRRRNNKSPAHGGPTSTPSSTLHADEMEVFKFSDDMSSLLELDQGCFARQNLSKNFMGFQSSCLFQ